MRACKWIIAVTLCLASVAWAQTITPNLNFNIPVPGTQLNQWGPLMNDNFSSLDCYLSGHCTLPALLVGPITAGALTATSVNTGVMTSTSVVTGPITATTVGGTNITASGSVTATSILAGALNTVTIYPSRLSGADASCKIQAAVAALPSTGGIVDARDLTDSGGSGACVIDPGTAGKTVTFLLGAAQYHFSQLVLRSNTHVIGMGSSNCGEPCNGTVINGTNNALPLVLVPATPPVISVYMAHLDLEGAPGNSTQDGIHSVAAAFGGLWYSTFEDISIVGFGGTSILLDSQAGGSPSPINQFLAFRDVTVFRPVGGGPALHIAGFNGQYSFDRCEFDGQTASDSTAVVISQGTTAPPLAPYTINFNNVTIQKADLAIDLTGVDTFVCHTCHFETLHAVLNINSGTTFGTYAITMESSYINGDVGHNSGNGYIINVNQSVPNPPAINFSGNYISATPAPDHMFTGFIANITGIGNVVGNNLPFNTIGAGLDPDGGGFKHQRDPVGCSTGASIGASCDATVTWVTPFPDILYTVQCDGLGIDNGVPVNGGVVSALAGSVIFRTVAATAAVAKYRYITCTAVYDMTTNF